MPSYIVLRLVPSVAVDPGKFTDSLNNLQIKVYDVSFANPATTGTAPAGSVIGAAVYQAPIVALTASGYVVTYPAVVPVTGVPTTLITQDFVQTVLAGFAFPPEFHSVATAVFEVPAGAPEYVSPNIRVEFLGGGATQAFYDPNAYWDVSLYTTGALTSADYQSIPASGVSAYVTLPPSVPAGLAQLQLSTDGTPPSFTALMTAVQTVMGRDPGGGVPTLAAISALSFAQCEVIAHDIVWGPHPALPAPAAADSMYTNPPNLGTNTDKNEQDRQDFEGNLKSYYATRNAMAERLASYVFALGAAVWCELRSEAATAALIEFPVNPGGSSTLTTVTAAKLIITGTIGIKVPAQYFYALAANLPSQVTTAQRYAMALGGDAAHNFAQLVTAVDAAVITVPPSAPQPNVNPGQAVRYLGALNVPPGTPVTTCALSPVIQPLWNDWLAWPTVWPSPYLPDATSFWPAEAAKGGAIRAAFLELAMMAVTQGYVVPPPTPGLLADKIVAGLPLTSVAGIKATTPAQWAAFFGTPVVVSLLPPFTAPGTPDARVQAFIRYVKQFFDLTNAIGAPPPLSSGAAPQLPLPSHDLIAACITAFGGLTFPRAMTAADVTNLEAAAAAVVPGDALAQGWLVEAIVTINNLANWAVVPGVAAPVQFSIMEALFARGFITADSILGLPQADFQRALTGTVAYDFANQIYANTGTPILFPPGGSPGPINDGALVDCIPPCFLSPFSPMAYLHEMLEVSEASTSEQPFAPPEAGGDTLGAALSKRRGTLGDLAVSCANLNTPLPMIDLVNECLEFMVSSSPISTHGTVYDTPGDSVAGHPLCADADCCCCREDCCPEDEMEDRGCSDAETLLAALPVSSTPGTPPAPGAALEQAAYQKLKTDFSDCRLPYSQPVDVARTYLRHVQSCRFEVMRTFHRCITEFVLDPTNEPAGFEDYLWRYPVRIDLAIEYLEITPEEYLGVFGGIWPASCGNGNGGDDTATTTGDVVAAQPAAPALAAGEGDANQPGQEAMCLPALLRYLCLDYCEFLALWKSRFIPFHNRANRERGFPDCEPCCPEDLCIAFENGNDAAGLRQLTVFVRLWAKLRHLCNARYSFDQLADICSVLQLFKGGTVNRDFIRQLAAFQMLRDQLDLPLAKHHAPAPSATGADRTQLLALWVGPGATAWDWAVSALIEGVEHLACCRYDCDRRRDHLERLLAGELDPMSRLAGFDPTVAADTWHALPTHTLRFAEILAKLYPSPFSVGDVLYLFDAQPAAADTPFALQAPDDAEVDPFALPDDDGEHSLWRLREKLLDAEARVEETEEEEERPARWAHVESFLCDELGFDPAAVADLGVHFFPDVLREAGHAVTPQQRRFTSPLSPGDTVPRMWNAPEEGPFRYDQAGQNLWTHVPLPDHEVIEQLSHVRPLTAPERTAVQDLYFQPRAMLAAFAMVFGDFPAAVSRVVEEPEEEERWRYFVRQVGACRAKCRIVAEHLAAHVASASATGTDGDDDDEERECRHVAALVLKGLYADENRCLSGSDWEADSGVLPSVTWSPRPIGGALAALLGLTGTGLMGEYVNGAGQVVWRDASGPLPAFGEARDKKAAPVPTVLPALDLVATPGQSREARILNGFGFDDETGRQLGGMEGFTVQWTGVWLAECDGRYEFRAVAAHGEHRKSWVVLTQGEKTWEVLDHHRGDAEPSAELHLRRGAYGITVRFEEPTPRFDDDDVHRQRSGFRLELRRPGHDEFAVIPHRDLFVMEKDAPLGDGISGLAPGAARYLSTVYVSSVRDIRRSYQRAFKAVLFARLFDLSARRSADGRSELGYMLENGDRFAGTSFYPSGGGFVAHLADFDFDFLPVLDNYHAPSPTTDSRARPALKRTQALFDWWERIFDYDEMRGDAREDCGRRVWPLFAEANDTQPASPGYLLRHLCADSRHWAIDLRYYQDRFSAFVEVDSTMLVDERWVVRAWHADLWVRRLRKALDPKDVTVARPDLWSSQNPDVVLPGEVDTGNANLVSFVCDACFDNGVPRRSDDIRELDDGLRERGRGALLAYLCGKAGVAQSPKDLSAMLLIDVEVALCQRASRIDEAITAVQCFVQRARLGLESGWHLGRDLARLWDARFASFAVWERCKRRELYKENWVEWHDLERAREVEGFRFLEEELRRATLTVAAPGGVDYWPDDRLAEHPLQTSLQAAEPAAMGVLPVAREGLNLLATQERAARPSWLAAVPLTGSPSSAVSEPLPYWLEAALELGTRFLRVVAADYPATSTRFEPRRPLGATVAQVKERCVECCERCGKEHCVHVEEYYFWLVDSRRFDPVVQDVYYDPAQQVSAHWHTEADLPGLLEWPSAPVVRLAWSRVHDGELQVPQRSVRGVSLPAPASGGPPPPAPDLVYLGRVDDSLYFTVTGASSAGAGFRYDLAPDEAVALEKMVVPAPQPHPGGLPAYPYFAYFRPGAELLPWAIWAPYVSVAGALRARCQFEAALQWYKRALDPLTEDCAWIHCGTDSGPTDTGQPGGAVSGLPAGAVSGQSGGTTTNPPVAVAETSTTVAVVVDQPPQSTGNNGSTCCDSTDVSCQTARRRAVVLDYLDTLLEWADALIRRGAPESFQQARLVLDTAGQIMGPRPRSIKAGPPPLGGMTVSAFAPMFPPLNPRLLALYDHVNDRLGLVHHCLDGHRLRCAPVGCAFPYWQQPREPDLECCPDGEWCHLDSPHRFSFLIQKAQELAGRVREFGNGFQAACEKGDAEYLAALHARNDHEIAVLGRRIIEDQWRDSDWQVQALELTKQSDQTSRRYYAGLIAAGLNNNELGYQNYTGVSIGLHTGAIVSDVIAEVMDIIPDLFVGFPCEEAQLPIGTKLAGMFRTVATVANTLGEIASTTASEDLTEAGWDRRLQDWTHQVQVLDIQIHQMEVQILGAERRRDQQLLALNSHQRGIAHSEEIKHFLRDKFTNHDLFLWLQKETAALYCQMFELACSAAKQAERAFNIERGHTRRRFVPTEAWGDLHEGLLAGERLELALARMDKAYGDENAREYELTKHISLRQNFPTQFLQLKLTGRCEIELCEWMFDLDYPGQYMRRIKSVSLSVPCVVGPYTGVHCRLTLLKSTTRIDPTLVPRPSRCCSERRPGDVYETCPHDERTVRQYGARESIATSSGQNDSGLFELSFHDDRYLPFEYQGTVSRWRLELPIENNYFKLDTLSDVVMHLNYTSREGGPMLRRAASEAAEDKLPACGWVFVDVRYDQPDSWARFHAERRDCEREAWLDLLIDRNMFPYIPRAHDLRVDRAMLLFETERAHDCRCQAQCTCAENRGPARLEVHYRELRRGGHDRDGDRDDVREVDCTEVGDCPDLYKGILAARLEVGHERGDERGLSFRFPRGERDITRVYVFCHYELAGEHDCDRVHRIERA